jgi:hypothetical protein
MESFMEIEFWAKLAAIVVGAVTAWNVVVSLLRGRKSQAREEYRFAREFLSDLKGVAKESAYLKQKGCYALVGDTSLEHETLEYLLGLNNPAQSIRDFSLGYEYLEHVVTDPHMQVRFKRRYANDRRRYAMRWSLLILYVLTYLLAFSPLLLHTFGVWGPSSPFPSFIFTATVFLPAAFFAVKSGVRLERAEKLVTYQAARPNNSFKPNPLRGSA